MPSTAELYAEITKQKPKKNSIALLLKNLFCFFFNNSAVELFCFDVILLAFPSKEHFKFTSAEPSKHPYIGSSLLKD